MLPVGGSSEAGVTMGPTAEGTVAPTPSSLARISRMSSLSVSRSNLSEETMEKVGLGRYPISEQKGQLQGYS